jgi:hypothetical protein
MLICVKCFIYIFKMDESKENEPSKESWTMNECQNYDN